MCNHPQISWVGTADGIHCGLCGALVDPAASVPLGRIAPKQERGPKPETEPEPEPVEEKTKKAPKKGGRK
jgi:hypothetical protein